LRPPRRHRRATDMLDSMSEACPTLSAKMHLLGALRASSDLTREEC
jgi:hypothetical protein